MLAPAGEFGHPSGLLGHVGGVNGLGPLVASSIGFVRTVQRRNTLAPHVVVLAHVDRKRQELWGSGSAGRSRRDRVVIRDQRGSIGGFRERRRGQRSLDGTVDGRKSVNGRELLRSVDGGVGRRGGRESSAEGAAVDGRSPRVWCLDTAAIGCAREGSGGGSRGRKTPPLAVHAAIPPVLDGVVTAVAQSAGNLGPTLAHVGHHAFDQQSLFSGNGLAVEGRFEVLVEALPTLLRRAVVHVLRDAHPVVRALFAHQLDKQLVLFGDPRTSTVSLSHCVCVCVCGIEGEVVEVVEW